MASTDLIDQVALRGQLLDTNFILANPSTTPKQAEEATGSVTTAVLDTLSSPIAATTAAVADAGVSLYNLASLAMPFDAVGTKDVLGKISSLGYTAPDKFFEKHDTTTHLLSMLTGGSKLATVATGGMMKLLKAGQITSLSKVSQVMDWEGTAKVARLKLAEAGPASDIYQKVARQVSGKQLAESVIQGAMWETNFAVINSQNPLMEHYSGSDWLIGAALGGGINMLTKFPADKKSFLDSLNTDQQVAYQNLVGDTQGFIASDFKGKPEGAILKVKQADQARKLVADTANYDLTSFQKSHLTSLADTLEKEAKDEMVKLFDADIKVTAGSKRNHAAAESFLNDSLGILRDPEGAATLAGIRQVSSYSEFNHIPETARDAIHARRGRVAEDNVGGSYIEDVKAIATHGSNLNVDQSAKLVQELIKSVRDIGTHGAQGRYADFAKGLVKLDRYKDTITKAHVVRLMNDIADEEFTVFYNTRTKEFLNSEEAFNSATGGDISANARLDLLPEKTAKKGVIDNRYFFSMPTHQADRLLQDMYNEGKKLKLLYTTPSKLESATIPELHKMFAFLTKGHKGNAEFFQQAGQLSKNLDPSSVTADSLTGLVNGFKERFAKDLTARANIWLSKGYSLGEISGRLGLDHAAATKLAVNPKTGKLLIKGEDLGGLIRNRSTGLKPTLVRLGGDGGIADRTRFDEVQLNLTTSAEIQRASVTAFITESANPLLNKLHELSSSTIGLRLKELAGKSIPTSIGGRFFGSSDMSQRNLPIMKSAIFHGDVGKEYIRKGILDYQKKIDVHMQSILSTDSSRIMFNVTLNAISSSRASKDAPLVVGETGLGYLKRDRQGNQSIDYLPHPSQEGVLLDNLPKDVLNFWRNYREIVGNDLLSAKNFNRKVNGEDALNDIGIKIPSIALHKKHRAYLIPKNITEKNIDSPTQLIHSNTEAGLSELITEARLKYGDTHHVLTPSQASEYNLANNRAALEEMTLADVGKQKTSATFDVTSADGSQIEEFLQGIDQEYTRLHRHGWKAMNSELLQYLERLHTGQAAPFASNGDRTRNLGKATPAERITKTIFNESELGLSKPYTGVNNLVKIAMDTVINKASDVLRGTGKERLLDSNPGEYIKRVTAEFDRQGISEQFPWKNANELLRQTDSYKANPKYAESAVATMNYMMTLGMLRFADMSYAFVNAVSVPITMMPEIMNSMEKSGNGKFAVAKLMMEGVRRGNSDSELMKTRFARWEEQGVTTPHVSEANEQLNNLAKNPTIVSKVQSNKLTKLLATPADYSEKMTRHYAAATGSAVADRVLGVKGVSESEHDAFVHHFVKTTMGNYSSNQRPVMFQGTLGSAIGLFQTYTWTLGQNVYKMLEKKQAGSLAYMVGAQGSIFGLQSLPGYQLADSFIGTHYGNANNDNITTSIYEQFGKVDSANPSASTAAEYALYGLPSAMLHSNLYTRGTLNPMSPVAIENGSKLGASVSFPLLSPIKATWDYGVDFLKKVKASGAPIDSFLKASQLQHLNRPLAGLATIAAGSSIDKSGDTLDPNAGITEANSLSTLARVMGSRPLREQALKSLKYTNQFYNSSMRSSRNPIVQNMKFAAQNDKLTPELIAANFTRYLELGGSVVGFRGVLNRAMLGSSGVKNEDLLKSSSSLNYILTEIN